MGRGYSGAFMSALATSVLASTPREKAGATTGARYAFQAHASLLKILELHQAGNDYRALFDHFDDLTILDSSESPSAIEFFQIKGSASAAWTMAGLCAAKGKAPQTIVGKMYSHSQMFGSDASAATFLSNAPFSFLLAAGGKTSGDNNLIPLSILDDTEKAAVVAALDLDFPTPRDPNEVSFIHFERTLVPIKGYDLVVKGKLVDLVDGDASVAVGGLYRTLISDITAKANDTAVCSTTSELYARKSLSRKELEALIQAAQSRAGALDHWPMVDDELKALGRTPFERIRVKTEVVKYLRARSKRDTEAVAMASNIRMAAAQVNTSAATCLTDITAMISGQLSSVFISNVAPDQLEAALLAEAVEVLNE